MEFYIGQIFLGGWNFNPRGSAFCEGQILNISQNTSLFSLLGNSFGGDARSNFRLPDLRGRSPIHHGYGPGLPDYRLGQEGGNPTTILNIAHLPAHNHQTVVSGGLTVGGAKGTTSNPVNNYLGASAVTDPIYRDNPGVGQLAGADGLHINTVNTGGSQAFSNQSPFLAISFCIALVGVFPSRS